MKLSSIKFVMCVFLALFLPNASGSESSELLDRLLLDSRSISSSEHIREHYKIVASEERNQIFIHVYVKFGSESKSQRKGQTFDARLSAILPGAKDRVIRVYAEDSALSAKLTYDEIRFLKRRKDIEWVEPWYVYSVSSPESHPLTNVDTAHGLGLLGQGQTMAIIDTEFLPSAFSNEIVGGYDYADDDSNFTAAATCTSSTGSHGTKVASIAAKVAPGAKLALLKLTSDSQCNNGGMDGDLKKALDWVKAEANDLNISALNMSIEFAYTSMSECESANPLMSDVINELTAMGVSVVAAAGNNKAIFAWPGCLPSTITVGAVYDDDIPPETWDSSKDCIVANCPLDAVESPDGGFSGSYTYGDGHPNAGDTYYLGQGGDQCPGVNRVACYSTSHERVDVLAPSNCATASDIGGVKPCFDGTSAAAPFVTGLVAMLHSRSGGNCIPVAQVKTILQSSGESSVDYWTGVSTPRVSATSITSLVEEGQCSVEGGASGLNVAALIAALKLLF